MASRRMQRLSRLLRDIIGQALVEGLHDPRIKCLVTVTEVKPTPDLRKADVYVSLLGAETDKKLTLRALESSTGHLQEIIQSKSELRNIPRLKFYFDPKIEKLARFEELMREAAVDFPPEDEVSAQDEVPAEDEIV